MVARYPRSVIAGAESVDPQDLSPKILHKMVAAAVPYASWKTHKQLRRKIANSNGVQL